MCNLFVESATYFLQYAHTTVPFESLDKFIRGVKKVFQAPGH